ncbi:hypothetical protein IFR05_002799 [Cadophora sp. M221]|nr:hypothetical protein IFR05_002799 [Cadophora sp. M221]
MLYRSTLLSGLAICSTLILANPLKIDISLETGDELMVPSSSDRTSVVSGYTSAELSTVLYWEPGFGGERQVYDRSDSSCQKIEGQLRIAFQSATITGYSEESQSANFLDSTRKAVSAQLDSSEIGLPRGAISPPGYKDTAKILFWNDPKFTGQKKRYQVIDEKCYNLPKYLVNYVLSAKLQPKVWYCTFYPEKACEAEDGSDAVHQLSAGEYDFLFPEGMDFVSFKCKLYERGPESPPKSPISFSAGDESTSRRPSSFQTVVSLSESETRQTMSPFAVQLYAFPDYQGPSSIRTFFPEELSCLSLDTPHETDFMSVFFGEEIESCSFYPFDVEDGCTGQAVLQRRQSETWVETAKLELKSMKCLLKPETYEVEGLTSDTSAELEASAFVPSVTLFLQPNFRGPFSTIPYYPGTWGCVPLKSLQELQFHSIQMSREFRSCSFFSEDSCNGKVVLRIEKTTNYVADTKKLPLRTMYCSFES